MQTLKHFYHHLHNYQRQIPTCVQIQDSIHLHSAVKHSNWFLDITNMTLIQILHNDHFEKTPRTWWTVWQTTSIIIFFCFLDLLKISRVPEKWTHSKILLLRWFSCCLTNKPKHWTVTSRMIVTETMSNTQ